MRLRHRLQSRLPDKATLSEHALLRAFAHHLHEPCLWHFGRRTVSRSLGYGMAVAFVPLPIHMVLLLPIALLRRLNLPVMVATVWVNNPLTLVPMFYAAYRVGLFVLGIAPANGNGTFSFDWHHLASTLEGIWLPLCVGCAICGTTIGIATRWLSDRIWRAAIRRRWRERHASRAA